MCCCSKLPSELPKQNKVLCDWINFTLCQSTIHSLLVQYTTLEVSTELRNLDVCHNAHRKCVHFYSFPWFFSVLCKLWDCASIWRRLLLSIYPKIETCGLGTGWILKQHWNEAACSLEQEKIKNFRITCLKKWTVWMKIQSSEIWPCVIRRAVPSVWNDHSAFIYKVKAGDDTTAVRYAQNLSSNDTASHFRRLWSTATKTREI